MSNSLGPGVTPSFSAFHPYRSCLHMEQWKRSAGTGLKDRAKHAITKVYLSSNESLSCNMHADLQNSKIRKYRRESQAKTITWMKLNRIYNVVHKQE